MLVSVKLCRASLCSSSLNRGTCVLIDESCVWCNATAFDGAYCINVTDTNTTTPRACGACSTYQNEGGCLSSYSSLSGTPCVWCTLSAFREGPYCSAVGEANPNCDDCRFEQYVSRRACLAPIDKLGRTCAVQCGVNVFDPVNCEPRPSNCTSCSTINREAFCTTLGTSCVWCNPSESSGPYCTSHAIPNPLCQCVATTSADCHASYFGDATRCAWCAPTVQSGTSSCVPQFAPPRWCEEYCWSQTTSASCMAASERCSWCGVQDTGYYCGAPTNPNCTILCTALQRRDVCEASIDARQDDCRWCNEKTDVGPYCQGLFELNGDCLGCSNYTNVTQCKVAYEIHPTASYTCVWCDPGASEGPFCSGYFKANPSCPSCLSYRTAGSCQLAFGGLGLGCRWCNPRQVNGSFCTDALEVNVNCPLCSSYLDSVLCEYAVAPEATACLWCNASATNGSYCTVTAGENRSCGSCVSYDTSHDCSRSSDDESDCVWCNSSAASGRYCTGLSSPNANCPCASMDTRPTCAASHSSAGNVCEWCAVSYIRGDFCIDPANVTCVIPKCELTGTADACTQRGCVWCSGADDDPSARLCQESSSQCPKCNDYGSSICGQRWSPGFTSASCFLCSPTQSSSTCAPIVPHPLDPLTCPSCDGYVTKVVCENSKASFNEACKWCLVSYSCVRESANCGDCFSFLIPGNRLKPYWLSFVAVVKDYLVLLVAVAVAPMLAHGWRRMRQRCSPGGRARNARASSGDDVVVYVAQDQVMRGGEVVGTFSALLRQAAIDTAASVDDVLHRCTEGDVMWMPVCNDGDGDGGGGAAGGGWVGATFVSSRHVLQRAAYATVLPPNSMVLLLNVLCAGGFVVAAGLQTHAYFESRRESNEELFGWGMFFVVTGYRVVNSGLQPTAALTLWQVVRVGWGRFWRWRGMSADASCEDVVQRTLSRWERRSVLIGAIQLGLFSPIWGTSLIGVCAYGWVLLPGCGLLAAVALTLRRVTRWIAAQDGTVAFKRDDAAGAANDGERRPLMRMSMTAGEEASAVPPATDAQQTQEHGDDDDDNDARMGDMKVFDDTPSHPQLMARLPSYGRGRQLGLAVVIFLSERALPVLAVSTALQTGYNYAALYVLAPGHVYCGYVDAVGLEYAARSEACLAQEVQDALSNSGSFGDAIAGALSYVLPFA